MAIKQQEFKIIAWAVNTSKAIKHMYKIGVDHIIFEDRDHI
ncbi:hypothetical protein [Sediminibacter sp. Hel_I_10]|nr:hypothetical protein [Sediminibacter sp. Hel_I_10]